MGDFSRKTGLQVYCDGELVDGDVLGTNGNHVKSDNPQNFFVGRSVNQGAHARFQLASISTFKGALSPKTISHIYSYFWRQGKERSLHLVPMRYGNHLLLLLTFSRQTLSSTKPHFVVTKGAAMTAYIEVSVMLQYNKCFYLERVHVSIWIIYSDTF